MFDPYGILALAGVCVLLVIWIHARLNHRPSRLVDSGRERVTLSRPLRANREGDDLDYEELQQMSRAGGFQSYRLRDSEVPPGLLEPAPREQLEMLLQRPEDSLLLILHVAFTSSCAGAALHEHLLESDLSLADDGLYRKTREYRDGPVAVYYVANHNAAGSFMDGEGLVALIERITFFMQLPLRFGGAQAFKGMLQVAESVCQRLGGELLNERNEPLSDEFARELTQQAEGFASHYPNLA